MSFDPKIGDLDLRVERKIERGQSSPVYVLRKSDGAVFVRKFIRYKAMDNERRAITKLCQNQHENLIHVLNIEETPAALDPFPMIVDMEFCVYDLKEFNRTGWLPFATFPVDSKAKSIWGIMSQIASGVVFIHEHKEIHRDLKPQNVLYSSVKKVWKIADFGLTSEVSSTFGVTTGAARTQGYRAPELLHTGEKRYTNKVDIWALGCILYELAIGKKAFIDDIAVVNDSFESPVMSDLSSESFSDHSKAKIIDVLVGLLSRNPDSRPDSSSLHLLFSQYDLELKFHVSDSSRKNDQTYISNLPEDSGVNTSSTMPIQPSFPAPPVPCWKVYEASVNNANTRIVTLCGDESQTKSSVALWNPLAPPSSQLLRREELYNEMPVRWDPVPGFSGNGNRLIMYLAVEHTGAIWDATDGHTVGKIPLLGEGHLLAMALNQDASRIATAHSFKATGEELGQLRPLENTSQQIDLLKMRGIRRISLCYGFDEDFLFGLATSNSKYQTSIGFIWDTRTRMTVKQCHFDEGLFNDRPLFNSPAKKDSVIIPFCNPKNGTESPRLLYGYFNDSNPFVPRFGNDRMFIGPAPSGFWILSETKHVRYYRPNWRGIKEWDRAESIEQEVQSANIWLFQWDGSQKDPLLFGNLKTQLLFHEIKLVNVNKEGTTATLLTKNEELRIAPVLKPDFSNGIRRKFKGS